MKGLTSKEEEIMNYFWHKGPLFVKELLDFITWIFMTNPNLTSIRYRPS